MILFNSLMRKPAKLKNTRYRTGILKYECANEMQANLASTVQRGQLNLSWTGQTLQVGKPRGHLTLPHTKGSPSRARKTNENPIPPQENTLRLQHTVQAPDPRGW